MNRIIPEHIAFIMDGNGRWAKKRALPRKFGHREGAKTLRMVIQKCKDLGIKVTSFYAFSTENWKRDQDEIDSIFNIIKKFADEELDLYCDQNYRVQFMGDLSKLPKDTMDSINKILEKSKNNTGMIINIALNYGARNEIVNAINNIISLKVEKVDEKTFNNYLYSSNLPDPDVIVRTSGEQRLSNFMLWQACYSELIFIKELWPDVKEHTIEEIIDEYSKRNRRFGK